MEPDRSLFSDDARTITEIIQRDWSLGPDSPLSIAYVPESYVADARVGFIYAYPLTRTNEPSTTDYRLFDRHSRISLRISNRSRDEHFRWCGEVYRILMANRRPGKRGLRGYTYLNVLNDRMSDGLSGWYTTTIDIDLVSHNTPIHSAGFGHEVRPIDRES